MLTNEQHANIVDLMHNTKARTKLEMLLATCDTIEDEHGISLELEYLDNDNHQLWEKLNA